MALYSGLSFWDFQPLKKIPGKELVCGKKIPKYLGLCGMIMNIEYTPASENIKTHCGTPHLSVVSTLVLAFSPE